MWELACERGTRQSPGWPQGELHRYEKQQVVEYALAVVIDLLQDLKGLAKLKEGPIDQEDRQDREGQDLGQVRDRSSL